MSVYRILAALCCLTLLFACSDKEKKDNTRIPFLEVGGSYLYVEDIEAVIPDDASKEDSLSVANDYVRKWVTDVLLYKHASKNISDKEEIEKLVKDYKKSLVIHQYEENLIHERLADVLTEKRLQTFYESYKDKFRLKNCIIKGVYIQVPVGAPKYKKLQKWLSEFKDESIEKVEKYSVQNATSYQYFGDKWVKFNEVTKNMPLQIDNPAVFIKANKYIEVSDSSYHYILRILDANYIGDIEPFELSKEKIQTILMNKERIDFIKNFENKLYQNAVDDDDITYFKRERVE